MTVAAQPDIETPAEEPTPTLHDRLDAVADDFLSKTGAEEPAAAQAAADGTGTSQAGSAPMPDETPAAESWVAPTTEQLRDKAWWGALSTDGWERATKDHPVEAAHVKASQAAGTRIVNDARTEAQRIIDEAKANALPADTRNDQPSEDEPSAELVDLMDQYEASFDSKERAKLLLKMQRLSAPAIAREIGVDPNSGKAQATLAQASQIAVKEHADLAAFFGNDADTVALDKIAEASPVLKALIETGTVENIAIALVDAGRQLTAQKKAEAERQKAVAAQAKEKERQKTVASNARPASADVLNPHGATQQAKMPIRQRLHESKAWDGYQPS